MNDILPQTRVRRKRGEKLPPMTAEQQALMEKFLPHAMMVINTENKRWLRPTQQWSQVTTTYDQRHFNYDDMYSAGIDGLVQAIYRMDASLHLEQQKAYVALKVRNYILDRHRETFFYRAVDPVTKKSTKGRPKPLSQSITNASSVIGEGQRDAQVTLGSMVDNTSDPAKEQDHIDAFERMIRILPAKEKHIYRLYFMYDYTMKEIGQIMQLTESRISQIFSKNNLLLCEHLSKHLDEVLS